MNTQILLTGQQKQTIGSKTRKKNQCLQLWFSEKKPTVITKTETGINRAESDGTIKAFVHSFVREKNEWKQNSTERDRH